jgi:DNA-binding transcriptional LysR family regulator
MDRLEAMAVFVAVAGEGSLSAASRRLNVPLATVSRKLSDLEAHLKTRLLIRSTRQLTLTDAGRDYLAACRQILEQVDEAELVASGAYANARGELVVAAPLTFGRLHVVPVVAEFLEQYPEVDLRLLLGDRNVNLLEEHVDVALRIGALPDSSLVAKPLGTIRHVVCASPLYLARFGAPTSLADLSSHRCVTFEQLMASTAWTFTDARGSQRVAVRSRLSVTTADAAIAATLAGVGLTRVLSYQVADALRDGTLVRVLQEHEPAGLPVNMVHAGQGRLPMKSRAFIDFAAPRLRERLASPPVSRRHQTDDACRSP